MIANELRAKVLEQRKVTLFSQEDGGLMSSPNHPDSSLQAGVSNGGEKEGGGGGGIGG